MIEKPCHQEQQGFGRGTSVQGNDVKAVLGRKEKRLEQELEDLTAEAAR